MPWWGLIAPARIPHASRRPSPVRVLLAVLAVVVGLQLVPNMLGYLARGPAPTA